VEAPEPEFAGAGNEGIVFDEAQAFLGSEAMHRVEVMVNRVAGTDAAVLISGESGVGKELVARELHRRSPRHPRPFVKVNCAALPLELLESELFGHERGAFTGAHRAKPGKFELAHMGTMFLDEIGEMPVPLQAKLLHVLQDHAFARLGSQRDVRVDVRVIAATNTDLEALVSAGTFRTDLYYRLNVVRIHVPPLRERRQEIPGLVEFFLGRYAERYGRRRRTLNADTLERFMAHPWPGNVRQLENMVKRIVALDSDAWVLLELARQDPRNPPKASPSHVPSSMSLAELEAAIEAGGLKAIARRAADDAERWAIEYVLNTVRWNRLAAARRLKINYKTLLQKIRELGLDPGKTRRRA
jgi:two-component system response regulator AtoC